MIVAPKDKEPPIWTNRQSVSCCYNAYNDLADRIRTTEPWKTLDLEFLEVESKVVIEDEILLIFCSVFVEQNL